MSVARPAVIEELFAMIGDEDDQRVVENSQIAELAYQRLETTIVVRNLSVISIDCAPDPLGGINALWRADPRVRLPRRRRTGARPAGRRSRD